MGRMSACRDPAAIAAAEGVIDPVLRMLSFWHGDRPIVCLTCYASHQQSYYGKGDVTAEFVGLARAQRERELPGLPHVHFSGAGANVAAGKYTDGAYVLHMPGELFVEYQLAAQQMRPKAAVCMAAYGDYGPWYIGTEIAYWQGGYETGTGVSNVAPHVEPVLMRAIRELLQD
jgi:hypothetical protein